MELTMENTAVATNMIAIVAAIIVNDMNIIFVILSSVSPIAFQGWGIPYRAAGYCLKRNRSFLFRST
jgi:hypothetical protein